MGSELSIQNCVSDVQSCASNASSSSGDNQDVLMVQLSQPFGMTLCSEEYEESVVKTVAECEADGNAAAAGVVDGMILLQINGVDMQPIDLDTLSQFITALPPNKIITLTFLSRNNSVPDTTHVKTNHSVPATSDNRRGNNQEPAHAATAIDKKAPKDKEGSADPSPSRPEQQTAAPTTRAHSHSQAVSRPDPDAEVVVMDTAPPPPPATAAVSSSPSTSTSSSTSTEEEEHSTIDEEQRVEEQRVEEQRVEEQRVKVEVVIPDVKSANMKLDKVASPPLSPAERERDIVSAALKKLDLKVELEEHNKHQAAQAHVAAKEQEQESAGRLRAEAAGTGSSSQSKDPLALTQAELTSVVETAVRLNAEQQAEIAQLKADHEEVLHLKAELQRQAREDNEELARVKAELKEAKGTRTGTTTVLAAHHHPTAHHQSEEGEVVRGGVHTLLNSNSHANSDSDSDSDRMSNKMVRAEPSDTIMTTTTTTTGRSTVPVPVPPPSVSAALQPGCVVFFSTEEKEIICRGIQLLQSGVPVKKHNRLVAPSAKWLHMDADLEKLYWRNEADTHDNTLKKSRSQLKLFGKSDSEREVSLRDILEVSVLTD